MKKYGLLHTLKLRLHQGIPIARITVKTGLILHAISNLVMSNDITQHHCSESTKAESTTRSKVLDSSVVGVSGESCFFVDTKLLTKLPDIEVPKYALHSSIIR
jgi:hypothetical protein